MTLARLTDNVLNRSQLVPLPFYREEYLASVKDLGEGFTVVPVHQDHPPWVAALDKSQEVIVARMSREVELLPLASHLHVRPVEFDDPLVHQSPPVRTLH